MYSPVNLSPVKDLLTRDTSPESLAHLLDEIAYDYARTILELHLLDMQDSTFVHRRAGEYLWTLRELGEVFRACGLK